MSVAVYTGSANTISEAKRSSFSDWTPPNAGAGEERIEHTIYNEDESCYIGRTGGWAQLQPALIIVPTPARRRFKRCIFVYELKAVDSFGGVPGDLNTKLEIQCNDNGAIVWRTPITDSNVIIGHTYHGEVTDIPQGELNLDFWKNWYGNFFDYTIFVLYCKAYFYYTIEDLTLFNFTTNLTLAVINVTISGSPDTITATQAGVYVSIDPPNDIVLGASSGFKYWEIDGVQNTDNPTSPLSFTQFVPHTINAVFEEQPSPNLLLPILLLGVAGLGIGYFLIRGRQRKTIKHR